ncbi:MAG: hypothetical protein WAX69_00430 [Victivallales bacterium]
MSKRKTSDFAARPPGDFAAVLKADEPLFLVGGQAVNLWALYYHERTVDLSPFVSRDVDVLGNRETVSMIARIAGVKPHFFSMRPPTNEVGTIIARSTDGQPLPVEVLSHLHGISNEDLHHPQYTVCIGDNGARVHVPGPIALLQAKIANVADLVQTGRQDKHHVRILARLMPAYLADVQASVADGRINESDMLNLLEHLLAVVTPQKALKILKGLEICGRAMFSEFKPTSSKLQAFMTKRLGRIIPAEGNKN